MAQKSALARFVERERKARGWSVKRLAEEMSQFRPSKPQISTSWIARIENDGNTHGPELDKVGQLAAALAANPVPGLPQRSVREYRAMLYDMAGYGIGPLETDDPTTAAVLDRIRRNPQGGMLMEIYDQLSPEEQNQMLRIGRAYLEDQQNRRRA